jgi:hypothetical protein
MIGFFMPNFWHVNHKLNYHNILHNFLFIGITFDIVRMNIKIHINEKSGYHHLQTSRTLC